MKKLFTVLLTVAGIAATQTANAAISSVNDLYGNYNAVYTWGITNQNTGQPEGAPSFLINPTIEKGSSENQILIKGLFPTNGQDFAQNATNPIVATVDLAAQTVTVAANQNLGTDKVGTNTLTIDRYDIQTGNSLPVSSVTATINEYGNICFPTEYIIKCQSSEGSYWYVYYTLTLQPYTGSYLHEASYYAGNYNTTFTWYDDPTDPFAQTTNSAVSPQIVVTGQYTLNINNLYPYLYGGISIAGEVLPSGDIKIDNVQSWENSNVGYQLIIFDKNTNIPDYAIAYLNENGTLSFNPDYTVAIGIYTGITTTNPAMAAIYGYQNLVLSDEAGVETIGEDLENAPVKYFDLNGRPIVNPQKGQVVIKQQGSKSYKTIAQ